MPYCVHQRTLYAYTITRTALPTVLCLKPSIACLTSNPCTSHLTPKLMPLRGTPSTGTWRCDYLSTGRRANEAHHHQTPSRRPRPRTDGGDRGAQSRARQASSEDLPELRARGPEPPGFLPGRPLLKTKMLYVYVLIGNRSFRAHLLLCPCYYSVRLCGCLSLPLPVKDATKRTGIFSGVLTPILALMYIL